MLDAGFLDVRCMMLDVGFLDVRFLIIDAKVLLLIAYCILPKADC
jgi:hypothetical protein